LAGDFSLDAWQAGMITRAYFRIRVGSVDCCRHVIQYASKRGYTTLDVAAIGLMFFAIVQLSIALDIKWMRPTAATFFCSSALLLESLLS
jgi:hypothetical protein